MQNDLREIKKANHTPWATQNDPQDEFPIKKAWRTWRALREIKKDDYRVEFLGCIDLDKNLVKD